MPRANNRKARTVKEPEDSMTLTVAHVKRLEQELQKFPSPSPYYKKKIASTLSKELQISDKIITNWLNTKCAKEPKTFVTIKPSSVVKKEVPTPGKSTSPIADAPKKAQTPSKGDTDDEIEIIDIDDDDDDKLLKESDTSQKKDSISLVETSSGQKKVEEAKEESKTFVRTVKLKSKTSAITNPSKTELDALKQKISELETKNRELKSQQQELRVQSKKKYDNLLAEYKDNLENKIGPMIEVYKNDLSKKEKEISKLKESQSKVTSGTVKEKELTKQLKEKEDQISQMEQKLKRMEADRTKREEERVQAEKNLREMKNSQILLVEKHKEELTRKEEALDKVTKKSLTLKEKFEKTREEQEKKDPAREKEVNDLKDVQSKLKKELESKEKELQKLGKVSEQKSKLEEEKKSLTKKMSKFETDILQKDKSIEALKQKVTGLEHNLKSKTAKTQEDLELVENEIKDLREVLAKKEEEIRELELREENSLGRSEKELLDAKNKLNETKIKLKEKNLALLKELEDKDKALVILRKDHDEKTEDLSAKTKIIQQCKIDLENAKKVITRTTNDILQKDETISALRKTVDEKDQEISKLEKEIQRKVLVFNDKIEAKNVEIRDKESELQEVVKRCDEFKDLSEKIKEKQLNIIKLSHANYEKDSLLAKKDEEAKKLSSRIMELHLENERTLKNRSIEEINNQNKLRHELLCQQQEMRRSLMAEMESYKQLVVDEQKKSENLVMEVKTAMKSEAAEEKLILLEKLEEKRQLLRKVKRVHLYREPEVRGSEKGRKSGEVPLQISYNWPLLHLSGHQQEASHFFSVTEALKTLLRIRPTSVRQNLPTFLRPNAKRKLEAGSECVESKRLRLEDITWPVVLYQPNRLKRKMELSVEMESFQSKKLRLEAPLGIVLNFELPSLPSLMKSNQQRVVQAAPVLMLTYEQPLPVPPTVQEDEIDLINIQCYRYRLRGPSVRSKTTGLVPRSEKVTPRRYRKPSFTPLTRRGKKRSFLEFLETLSHEEMMDLSLEMTDEASSLLDFPIKISPPAKRTRYTKVVASRTFPANLERDSFYFDFDEAHSASQTLINYLIDSVVQ